MERSSPARGESRRLKISSLRSRSLSPTPSSSARWIVFSRRGGRASNAKFFSLRDLGHRPHPPIVLSPESRSSPARGAKTRLMKAAKLFQGFLHLLKAIDHERNFLVWPIPKHCRFLG